MPEQESKIILASSSPRRADLLKTIGVSFELVPSGINERPHQDEAPADYIIRLARAKVIECRPQAGLGPRHRRGHDRGP